LPEFIQGKEKDFYDRNHKSCKACISQKYQVMRRLASCWQKCEHNLFLMELHSHKSYCYWS